MLAEVAVLVVLGRGVDRQLLSSVLLLHPMHPLVGHKVLRVRLAERIHGVVLHVGVWHR